MLFTQEELVNLVQSQVDRSIEKKVREILSEITFKTISTSMKIETAIYYILKKINIRKILETVGVEENALQYVEGCLYNVPIPSETKIEIVNALERSGDGNDSDSEENTPLAPPSLDAIYHYLAREIYKACDEYQKPLPENNTHMHQVLFNTSVRYSDTLGPLALFIDYTVWNLISRFLYTFYNDIEVLPLVHMYSEMGPLAVDVFLMQQLDVLDLLMERAKKESVPETELYFVLRNIKSIHYHWKSIIDIECLGHTLDWATVVARKCVMNSKALPNNAKKTVLKSPIDPIPLDTLMREFEYDVIMLSSGHKMRHDLDLIERAKHREYARNLLLAIQPTRKKVFMYKAINYTIKVFSALFIGISFALFLNRSLVDGKTNQVGNSYLTNSTRTLNAIALICIIVFNAIILQKQSFADCKHSILSLLEKESDKLLLKISVIGLTFTALFYVQPVLYTLWIFKYGMYLTCAVALAATLLDQFIRPRNTFGCNQWSTSICTIFYIISIAFMAYTIYRFTPHDINLYMV
ncbi:hypothetical protein NEMIN01_1714 [Nematocida minor]|uniref:uncharacterized protein n=1 Tax=Nematocida minor TaxID=1912983 RepID=UPI00222002E7|nr:uncharacterized protein NEMIN01_1714 [Nematocida minor]KAI5191859.1 hypothetical protein NEMIN01_1714 [Nematocida minor]